jgi:uncharacterized membrane protein
MTLPPLIWGSPHWMTGAFVLIGVATATLLWSYIRARTNPSVRVFAAVLKGLAFTALALILIEPLLTGSRPRRGANAFVILADNSQSLLIRDDKAAGSRGEWVRKLLQKETTWKTRLEQDFDVRGYVFDSHLRAVDGFEGLAFDGTATALTTSLSALSRRFRGLPLAGVLLVTDGNRTDVGDVDWSGLPPIYPVVPPARGVAKDVGVNQVSVSQTNFESAPVVVRADVSAIGFSGQKIVATVTDESGKVLERQGLESAGDGKPLSFRFQFRPERKGVSFYQVHAAAAAVEEKEGPVDADQSSSTSREQTLANNNRLLVVDQGDGQYRVLYVSGRPNWEFKFLNRAIEEDKQVQLVGLIRIAKRQAKFDFRSSGSRSTSALFDGFDHPDADTAERHDEPVFVRLATLDGEELRGGFPKAADQLYRYHAVVLDDLEAGFFTPDQQTLLRNFVSQRGGGLLMLGGTDSYIEGKYDRTPIGEMLPVYLNRQVASPDRDDAKYRLELTREGWLQPWVRTRKTEDEEHQRLATMSEFDILSHVGTIKPGAVVLSKVRNSDSDLAPALVAQQFGKGHVAALLIGDFWRWHMRRDNQAEDDLDRSWRQTVRWLVGDVPGRLEVGIRPKAGTTVPAIDITVRVRDSEYRPLDNAKVSLRITRAGADDLALDAEPDGREAGTYASTYVTKQPGAYRVVATATAPDGSAIGEREAGWAAQPGADEFAHLEPDREYLSKIASQTGGEMVDGRSLDSFVASLSTRHAPISEPWTSPLWHTPLYFLVAVVCLLAEWGLRRVNGLA